MRADAAPASRSNTATGASTAATAAALGATLALAAAGMSAFALEDGAVYHTYSARERGIDIL